MVAAVLTVLCTGTALADVQQPAADDKSITVKDGDVFRIIELDPHVRVTKENDYVISGLNTDILSDASRQDGWFYYYSEGTENGVPWKEWETANGAYTSCELLFDMTNLRDSMQQTFLERLNGAVVFCADTVILEGCASVPECMRSLKEYAEKNPDTELFDIIPCQENPGQTDSDGYPAWSKDAVLLGKDKSAGQRLIADVSDAFYRSWTDSNAGEPMWAFFAFDDNVLYAVNLRLWLKDADVQ